MRQRAIIFIGLSLVIVALSFLFRHTVLANHVASEKNRPWRIFYTETAIHYYFADQIREHGWSAFAKLSEDNRILYPQVTDDWRHYTIGMEFLPALLSRWNMFGDLTESIFFSTNVYFCLKIFLVFVLAFVLCRSVSLSLLVSVLVLVAPHSYTRSTLGFFVREDFGILFILGSVILYGLAHRRKSWLLAAFATLAVIVALNLWHLASFLYLPIVFAGLLCGWQDIAEHRSAGIVSILTIAFGCVLLPLTRHNLTFLSPFLLASLVVFLLPARLLKIQRQWSILAQLSGIFVFAIILGGLCTAEATNHVLSVTWEKVRQLFVRPENPHEISFLTRLYWEGDFQPPSWPEWYANVRWFVLAPGLILAAAFAWQKRLRLAILLPVILVTIGILLSIMARRNLMIANIFWGMAVLAGLWPLWQRSVQRRARIAAATAALALLTILPWSEHGSTNAEIHVRHLDPIMAWAKTNITENSVIAGHFSEMPSFLAFTQGKVTSHSKFENAEVRRRVEDYYQNIYQPRASFLRYLKGLRANVLLLNLNYFNPARLYQAGNPRIEHSALLHLARMTDHPIEDETFSRLLILTPTHGYALFAVK